MIASAALIRMSFDNVNTLEKQPNMSRKREMIPFSLHDSRRGLSFHLYLDFLHMLTTTTTDIMYWETGHVKIIKK